MSTRFRRFFRHPIVITIVAATIGLAAGWTVFSFSNLTGRPRFLVGGALTGVITGLAMIVYLRRGERFVLSEVTVTIPEFADVKFVVSAEYKRVAWKLFVETVTRISTQPLKDDEGLLRESLTSLYGLFAITRDLLKGMEPSRQTSGVTVEMFAIRMLNYEIRPFLAKWHTALSTFEKESQNATESNWPQANDCRSDLESLRTRVIDYALAFGELAGVTEPRAFLQRDAILGRDARST